MAETTSRQLRTALNGINLAAQSVVPSVRTKPSASFLIRERRFRRILSTRQQCSQPQSDPVTSRLSPSSWSIQPQVFPLPETRFPPRFLIQSPRSYWLFCRSALQVRDRSFTHRHWLKTTSNLSDG